MDAWKARGQAAWVTASEKCETGITLVLHKATEATERWPRAREAIANSCHNVRRTTGTATERTLATFRRTMASTHTTLFAVDYITIFFFLGIVVMFVVILCLPLIREDPSALYPYLVLIFVYLIFIWLPFYICVPEVLTNTLQEGQRKEESVREDWPADLSKSNVNLDEVGVRANTVKSAVMRNKITFASVGAMLMFAGCLGMFPLTIVGGFVMVIPFYYWIIDGWPGTHQEMSIRYQMPVPSPEEMNPPEYESLTPPPHLYTTPPAYEDILPCGEDTQTLLSNSPAVFAGVPLCSVHQPSIRPTDSNRSIHSQQTAPNVLESVRSQSLETL